MVRAVPSGCRRVLNAVQPVLFVSSAQNLRLLRRDAAVAEQSVPASVGSKRWEGWFRPTRRVQHQMHRKTQMYNIIYLVGLIVVVLAILSFVGLA